ncbi:MAG: hypothetical protein GX457_13205, partial [Thermotogaceae bacterium]|nr:hypothetical protein [Thermotogaceae bacterium]
MKDDIIDGEYRIRLDYYATHGQTQPVNCRVVIKRYGNTLLDQTFTLRNDDDTVEVMKVGVRKEEYDAYIQDLYRDVAEALWIELTWDKNHADIDLHVYEPDEEHVYYENMKGAGELDRDDTDGYGPEHYTLLRERAIYGDYRIMLHYYATHEQTQPVNCRVVIKRYGVTILDRVFTLT